MTQQRDEVAAAPAVRRGGRPRSASAHEAILQAAIDEWVAGSFSGLTIERIAARAGVARTTVYRRWPTLAQLCMEALESIREHLPEPPGESVRDDLLVLLKALRQLLTESRIGRLVPQLVLDASRHPDLSLTYWNDYLRRGASAFGVRPDLDVELAIDLLTGPLFKRSLWHLTTSDEDLTTTVDTILTGLAPPRRQ